MKRKSIVAILFVTLLLLPVLMFTSCDQDKVEKPHEHTFAAEWMSNETHHWHAATCEHAAEVKDKAEHVWDEGVVSKEPTATEKGEKTFTCEVCKKTRMEEIEALGAKENTLTFGVESLGKVYDGNPIDEVSVTALGGANVTVTYHIFEEANKFTSSITRESVVGAGKYTVRAVSEATDEYKETVVTKDFEIAPKPIEGSITVSRIYTGSEDNVIFYNLDEENGIVAVDEDIKLKITMTSGSVGSIIKNKEILDGEELCMNYSIGDSVSVSASITPIKINSLLFPFPPNNMTLKIPTDCKGVSFVANKDKAANVLEQESLDIIGKFSTNALGATLVTWSCRSNYSYDFATGTSVKVLRVPETQEYTGTTCTRIRKCELGKTTNPVQMNLYPSYDTFLMYSIGLEPEKEYQIDVSDTSNLEVAVVTVGGESRIGEFSYLKKEGNIYSFTTPNDDSQGTVTYIVLENVSIVPQSGTSPSYTIKVSEKPSV